MLTSMYFHKEKVSKKIQETNLWQRNKCWIIIYAYHQKLMGIRLTFLVENCYEQPFLAIPKPNVYRIFTKKWSPLKPHAPDLWQGKNYGVRNRSIS